MSKRAIVRALVLLGLAAVVGGLIFSKVSAAPDTQNRSGGASQEESATLVTVDSVAPTRIYDTLSLVGTLEASEVIAVRNEMPGKVVSLGFEEGQPVRQGQQLVQMRDDRLRAQRQVASRRAELLELEVNRLERALEDEAVTQREYDVAVAEWEIARAEIAEIDAQIDQMVVRAPFDGVMGLREISEGAILSQSEDIAWLRRVDELDLQFSIPERFTGSIGEGQALRFQIFGDDKIRRAEITAIESGLDSSSRTLRVQARVANAEGALRAGALANVQVILETMDEALTVPAASIVESSEGATVWVNEDGTARERAVRKGHRTHQRVEIRQGLSAGEEVVVTGRNNLADGDAIEIDDSNDAVDIEAIGPDGTTSGMRNQWFSESELDEQLGQESGLDGEDQTASDADDAAMDDDEERP